MIKLYNLATNRNSQDRVLFTDANARDLDFTGLEFTEKEASNLERLDDLNFSIDVYNLPFGTSYNYAIYKGYHLFIESAIEKDENTTRLIGVLDTITQYMLKDNLDINKEVFVKRTHLDRFKQDVQGEFTFDFDNDELLVKEDISVEPIVIDEDSQEFSEYADKKLIKWLAITKPASLGKADNVRMKNVINHVDVVQKISLSNRTLYFPMIDAELTYYSGGVLQGTAKLVKIINHIKDDADILDVKVVPYLNVHDSYDIYYSTANSRWEMEVDAFLINFLDITDPETACISDLEHGKDTLMHVEDNSYIQEHIPVYTETQVRASNIEPKLFQFHKYIISYLQENVDIFYDMLKGELLNVITQRAVNYATSRIDVYITAGLYNNARNSGAMLSCVSDNTIGANLTRFAQYLSDKKVSGSAGYMVGKAVIGTAVQTTVAGITTGGLGAGVSVSSGIMNISNSIVQRADLKQAPDTVKSRGSNIINDICSEKTFGLTVTKGKPLQTEIDMITKFLYQNGYKYDKYNNLLNLIDSRENFNYIETLTKDNILTVGITNTVLQDILRQLNEGVRFYKSLTLLASKPDTNTERTV